jgi:amino acid permease
MEKTHNQTFTSAKERALAYIYAFTIAALLSEFIHQFITINTMIPGLSIFFVSIVAGWILVNNRNVLSRITSVSTMLVLSTIAIKLGYTAIPDAYLLALAIGISALGAQPFLHTQPASQKLTILYGSLIIIATVVAIALFTYGTIVLNRLATPLL